MTRRGIILLAAALAVAGCGGTSRKTSTTSAKTAPTTATTAAGASGTDCNTLGINPTKMREGTCTHAGVTFTIVDENHTLKLSTLWASLDSVRSSTSLPEGPTNAAGGKFVRASVTITNKLPATQGFDHANTQQAALNLGGILFKEDVSAEAAASNSCPARGRAGIRPGKSITCELVFVVPAAAAAQLGKHGSGDLYLVNFGSDLSGSVVPQAIGQIRLYH